MSVHVISLTVNGEHSEHDVEARTSLLDFLRQQLALRGAHAGCEHGVCGTCTVLVDGRSVRACLMLAVQAQGADVVTVEGLNRAHKPGELNRLQTAFWDKQALQCGYCTPGMLIRAHELLTDTPAPTREQVRLAISSNLCRCTGYEFIIDAVMAAAEAGEA